MRFLVDNQLPPALALNPRKLDGEALHVPGASSGGFIVVSKDEDFENLSSKSATARLLWVRLGNCRRAHLLHAFEWAWPGIIHRFASGDRFVELR